MHLVLERLANSRNQIWIVEKQELKLVNEILLWAVTLEIFKKNSNLIYITLEFAVGTLHSALHTERKTFQIKRIKFLNSWISAVKGRSKTERCRNKSSLRKSKRVVRISTVILTIYSSLFHLRDDILGRKCGTKSRYFWTKMYFQIFQFKFLSPWDAHE